MMPNEALAGSSSLAQEIVAPLIGLPWEIGAEGPHAYDCWGLARMIQREVFGREVPAVTEPPESTRALMRFIKEHAERSNWRRVEEPSHGCMVEMAHNSHPFHIGVFLDIDGGGIVHSMRGQGVCWDRVATLRLSGWRRINFHEWAIG